MPDSGRPGLSNPLSGRPPGPAGIPTAGERVQIAPLLPAVPVDLRSRPVPQPKGDVTRLAETDKQSGLDSGAVLPLVELSPWRHHAVISYHTGAPPNEYMMCSHLAHRVGAWLLPNCQIAYRYHASHLIGTASKELRRCGWFEGSYQYRCPTGHTVFLGS